MKKIIILGATSEIAQHTARILARRQKRMLLVGRSEDRLSNVAADLLVRGAEEVIHLTADLSDLSQHPRILQFANECFPDFDCVLLAYGSMQDQQESFHSVELAVREWEINFVSAAALLTAFAKRIEVRGYGCIAAITSVAGDRGRPSNYVYGAAKGALSLFLQGLRARLYRANVRVLTIKPGPVKTPMTQRLPQGWLFADASSVARDICRALENRSPDVLYTPSYWRWVVALLQMVPEGIYKRLRT